MKRIILLVIVLAAAKIGSAQKVDSIYFHLYTDSLKKGRHNYINVDGKLNNGRYLPLTASQVTFTSNTGRWEGNDVIIDSSYKGDSVIIEAVLKENPAVKKKVVVHIKKSSFEGTLANEDHLFNDPLPKKKNRKTNR